MNSKSRNAALEVLYVNYRGYLLPVVTACN